MSLLDKLFGNDHQRAATQYAGRESASERATRRRRESHRRGGADRAARAGQAWEDRDRNQDRAGRWYRPTR
ncbi:hypothetical protein AB0N77_09705 [Streptomyces misionensis]|uniref:hypothetical protein n=1 Tax=Streptomyces misionensis TaxID=67331 RepID=UPI0034353BF6